MHTPRTRIQLCGGLAAEIEGRRIEHELPGRKGRLLFVYLVANRDRTITRDELVEAVWPERVPSAVDGDLRALVSKVRRAIGQEALGLRNRFRLDLPADAWIDLEAAARELHHAEAAIVGERWARAWSSSLVALFTARRGFLPDESGRWIDDWRDHLEEIEVRAFECFTAASIGVGGSELPAAERNARKLVKKEPYRESSYRLLMEALAKRGNCAEAIQVYEDLRHLLREGLGVNPSLATQELHKRLLREPALTY